MVKNLGVSVDNKLDSRGLALQAKKILSCKEALFKRGMNSSTPLQTIQPHLKYAVHLVTSLQERH